MLWLEGEPRVPSEDRFRQRCKQRRRAESDRQRAGRQRRVDRSHVEVEVRQGWFGCVFLIIVFVCKGGAAKAERHQQGKRDDFQPGAPVETESGEARGIS